VSATLSEQAPAKINLTLRVLGRRGDGYHELESLVAFADLADTLALQPGAATGLDVAGPFAAVCGLVADNLVLKAVAALRERVAGLKAGHFQLTKKIPVAGGLGGGSADAAAALRLLARLNDLPQGDARLTSAALAVGADVPVCLDARPRVMRGIGDELSAPLDLPRLPAALINPRVPLATRDVFAGLAVAPGGAISSEIVPLEPAALIGYLKAHGNDLTKAATARAPVVAEVLRVASELPGARFAAMSGSGPTCFVLFTSPVEAAAAALRLQSSHKQWWIHAGNIGAQP
jgi:4-diphosphocytidyl-2-C-methyl-D-erythritol kinase